MARLLFIGDSLIEYFDWEQRFPDYEVYNLGIAGETVGGLRARLKRIFANIATPDKVFIMSGINNMAMGDEDFLDDYRRIVSDLAAEYPAAMIYVHSLLPVLFPYIANENIREMNAKLRGLALKHKASFFDLHAAFLDEKGKPRPALFEDDGVHVSEEGYRIWSAAIEKLLVT